MRYAPKFRFEKLISLVKTDHKSTLLLKISVKKIIIFKNTYLKTLFVIIQHTAENSRPFRVSFLKPFFSLNSELKKQSSWVYEIYHV